MAERKRNFSGLKIFSGPFCAYLGLRKVDKFGDQVARRMKIMKRYFNIKLICFVILLFYAPVARAVSITYEEGTIYYIDSVASGGTYGDDMEGMEVSVTFVDGTVETAVWQSLGSGSGGAFGSDWSLQVESGSTYPNSPHFSPWSFESDAAVTSLTLDAGNGDFVFDGTRTYASNPLLYPSTLNSGSGWPFESDSSLFDSSSALVTYSNAVALVGAEPVGDLYRTLTIMPDLSNWSGSAMSFTFQADTDTVNPAPVPEPASMTLMGIGLASLAALTGVYKNSQFLTKKL
ncbi:PEP-CTERM sorting domain-containing protein [Desulfolithobacter sp.]